MFVSFVFQMVFCSGRRTLVRRAIAKPRTLCATCDFIRSALLALFSVLVSLFRLTGLSRLLRQQSNCVLCGFWQAAFRLIQSGLPITWGFVSAQLTHLSSYFSSFFIFSHRPGISLLSIVKSLYLRFFHRLLSQPTDYIRRAEHKA